MKYLLLSFAAIAVLSCLTSAQMSKRCQSVCSRSDGQEFCQRCRMRVPMRFGKRVETPLDSRDDASSESKQSSHLQRDVPDGPYDESSRLSESNNLQVETRLLLNSMRNFARDLEEWDREFYDQ
ncbi:uncharacterized protein TNIN_99331 [Trichonephila inaurata madagascariensis]|uniref:Uncharacterized protein n=1 Tax=Trichonephila inaurata madagascariensis TaxID=2747483 RepID=A0A8X6YIU1_9ARAC|nr:uncharacterized protein TNIN_99331 [Trichonephila inaurata madagascariensis]